MRSVYIACVFATCILAAGCATNGGGAYGSAGTGTYDSIGADTYGWPGTPAPSALP